jgi:hypothetical protein
MVTVKCSRCGQVGEVYGPGLHFCRKCGLMAGVGDPPPKVHRGWGWEQWRWPLVALIAFSVLYTIVESGGG